MTFAEELLGQIGRLTNYTLSLFKVMLKYKTHQNERQTLHDHNPKLSCRPHPDFQITDNLCLGFI